MRETTQKRWLMLVALIVAGVFGLALLAGCGGQQEEKKAATEETTEQEAPAAESTTAAPPDNTLIVGFDAAYPPYGFQGDDGEYTGLDLEMAQEVAKRNGWEIKLEPIDWDAKDALLNQGTINCIWNGFTMEGRENDYTFSEPYMLNEQVVVVKADSPINGFEDLADKNVMTQVDSAALDVLEGDMADVAATFAGGAPQTIGDYNNAFMQLESGAVDAVACDLSVAQYQMAAKPDAFKQLERVLSSEHYAVGFKIGDTALADVVTNTLYDMYEDGTIKQLCDKYAEYGVSIENWTLNKPAGTTTTSNTAPASEGEEQNTEATTSNTADEAQQIASEVEEGNDNNDTQ